MATELAKAYVQIVPSAEGLGDSLTSMLGGEASSAGNSSGKTLGSTLASAALGMFSAAQIGKAISASINEGMDFDSAMSQLAATMGTTTDQIQELRDYAQEMGATTAFSATEAAEGLNTLAMSGLDAEEQIAALPSVMNLASAGALSLDSAASYVTGTIKGFGDEMENADYYADMMAKGATLANTNVNDLGEALSGAAATANSYGQEADSVTVALLRLAEQNITGSEATTMLNRTMSDLYTPTDAAKSALEELGVATYDEQGNARDLNDVVDELDDALSGMSQEEANVYKDTIFTTNGLKGFNDMTASSDETVQKFKDGLEEMGGSAAQQAATQLDNLSGDVTLFNSAVSGAEIAVSDALTPALREVTQFGTDAISAFTEGFLEDGLNGVLTAGADIVNSLSEGISNNLSGILDCGIMAIGDFIGGLGTNVNELIAAGLNLIGSLLEGIIQSIPTLVAEAPVATAQFIAGFASSIPDVIQAGWDLLNSVAEGITTAIPQMVEQIPEVITNVKSAFMDTDWAQVASDILDAVGNGIVQFASLVTDMVSQLASDAIEFFTGTDWTQAGKDAIDFIVNGVTELFDDLPGKIQEIANNAIEYFQEADWVQQGRDLIDNIVSGVTEFFSHIGEKLQEVAQDAIEKFKETDWLQLGQDLIDGIIEGITGAVGGLLGSVGTFCSDVFGKVKGFFGIGGEGDMEEQGEQISEGLAEGIEAASGEAEGAAEEAGNGILGSIKSFFGISSPSTVMEEQGEYLIEGLTNGMENQSGESNNKIAEIGEGILGSIKGFFGISGDSSSVMEEQGESMSNGVTDGFDDLSSGVTDCFDEMGNSVESWCNNSQASMENAGKDMDLAIVQGMQYLPTDIENEALKPATSAIDDWASSASKSTKGVGEDIADGVTSGMKNLPKDVQSVTDSTMKNVSSWGTSMMKEATNDAKNFVSNIKSGMDSLPKDVSKLLDTTLNNVTSWSTKMMSQATQTATNFVTNVYNGLSSLATKVGSRLDSATSKITSWQSTLNSKGQTAGEKLSSGVYSGLSELNSNITSRLDSANTKISNYNSTFKSSGETLGSNLIAGMVNGLNNNSSSLYNTVSKIVSQAISTANSAAKTGSPSKETMWTGEMMDRGLALGLTKYENLVDEAMEDVMSIVDGTAYLNASGVADYRANTGEESNGAGVTVVQNIYSEAKTAAQLMREARYQQQRALMMRA